MTFPSQDAIIQLTREGLAACGIDFDSLLTEESAQSMPLPSPITGQILGVNGGRNT